MNVDKIINSINYLTAMIKTGIYESDKDCIRSHLEDLNYLLSENNLIGD